MAVRFWVWAAVVGAAWVNAAAGQAQPKPPYWGSIDEPKARMRTGPAKDYPTMWVYRREQLPLKIIARFEDWRKVEDHEGTQGWMHARLLSGTRTALVQGEVRPMRGAPRDNAPIVWRAQPGVVGKISECGNGWCLLDVKGRRGYIRTDHIWGDEALQ